MKKTVQGTT